MGKLILDSTVEIDSAHYLQDYEGKCKNLHGHRWKIQVLIEGSPNDLDKAGMLIDFGTVKDILNRYDHAILVYEEDKHELDRVIDFFMSKDFTRVEVFPFNTTAENLAVHWAEEINYEMSKRGLRGELIEIRVWETEHNKISYFPKGNL